MQFKTGDYVLLAVSDNGCGIAPQTLDKIFDPFFSTKEVGEGSGLGLSIVYGIVKQNAGFIDVASKPDQGTTVKIYLPCHTEMKPVVSEKNVSKIVSGQGEILLLVEDEKKILEFGELRLGNLGYKVLTAATPGEALHIAKNNKGEINLLITDVVMPEMNGRELAERLQTFYRSLAYRNP